jgi:aspartate/methionine/tyrosine aminotransferase
MDGWRISTRGARLITGGMPPYVDEHKARSRAAAEQGTDRYIGLCIAENMQMWDLLGPRLTGAQPSMPSSVTGYDAMEGSEAFRRGIAHLVGRLVFHRTLDPSTVVTMAGAGSILEALFYALAGPGDGVLVPTPSYAGFWPDLEGRDGLTVVPVHTTPETDFRLTTDLLDRALASSPVPIRALLHTRPDNPLGRVASPAQVDEIAAWCARHGIHLVADEIYALSVFGDEPFTSIGAMRDELGASIHWVWAFSKDFAISGLRCGVLISENAEVISAVRAQAPWGSVSTHTQALLGGMITDDAWVDHYVHEMRSRLGSIDRRVERALGVAGIPFFSSDAGFFVLVDLRRFLDAPTWEAEQRLWRRMLDEANVNLTPGSACRVAEPGFFRLCFAPVPVEDSLEAIARLATILHRRA